MMAIWDGTEAFQDALNLSRGTRRPQMEGGCRNGDGLHALALEDNSLLTILRCTLPKASSRTLFSYRGYAHDIRSNQVFFLLTRGLPTCFCFCNSFSVDLFVNQEFTNDFLKLVFNFLHFM